MNFEKAQRDTHVYNVGWIKDKRISAALSYLYKNNKGGIKINKNYYTCPTFIDTKKKQKTYQIFLRFCRQRFASFTEVGEIGKADDVCPQPLSQTN